MDKSKFKDSMGRYITQGLFLENRYDQDMAVFTIDGEDKLYEGKTYPSLKKLYLEYQDPKEWAFANEYLFDWDHWQRMVHNKWIGQHVHEWRKELELKLVAEGVSVLINLAVEQDSYQAAKWLAERGWDKSTKGRPSKEEVDGELKKRANEAEEWGKDFQLLQMHKDK